VRKICRECKDEIHMPSQALVDIGFPLEESPKLKLFKGRGCGQLQQHGLPRRLGSSSHGDHGRDPRADPLRASAMELKRRPSTRDALAQASGLQKLRDGQTTVEEVVRETVL